MADNKLEQEFAVYKETTRLALESLQKQLEQSKTIAALDFEVKSQFERLKWLGVAVTVSLTIAGTVLGIVGFRSVDDYVKGVRSEINAKLDRISSFYYDFTKGNALVAAGNAAEAVPYLKRCFEQERSDESVIIPLLSALDSADDWQQGIQVVQQLKSDRAKFAKFKNPFTHINIGIIQLQAALEQGTSTDEVISSLGTAQRMTTNDDFEGLKYVYLNLWLCNMARGEAAQAQQAIDRIKLLPSEIKVDDWEKVQQYGLYKRLTRKKPSTAAMAKQMWLQLQSRFS